MRGAYTSGILETLLEEGIHFPYVIGVSAGACSAVSYLSRQKDRNRRVNVDLIGHPDYLSFKNILTKGQVFGMDFLFDRVPNEIDPFDFKAFNQNVKEFVMVTTDCETGQPYYIEAPLESEALLSGLRATSSLPYMAPIVPYEQKHLLDGGLSDPIPIKRTFEDGCQKAVVVLTRNKGYRKDQTTVPKVFRFKYRRFPRVIDVIHQRYEVYNESMDYLEQLEEEGCVYIIRPLAPLKVKRVERNQKKLEDLYQQGVDDMRNQLQQLRHFMES